MVIQVRKATVVQVVQFQYQVELLTSKKKSPLVKAGDTAIKSISLCILAYLTKDCIHMLNCYYFFDLATAPSPSFLSVTLKIFTLDI